MLLASSENTKAQSKMIIGEWMYVPTSLTRYDDRVGLEFTDSAFYFIYNGASLQDGNYIISLDSVKFSWEGKDRGSYKIVKLTEDSLILKSSGKIKRLYCRKLDFNPELQLEGITFTAGPCFGLCPEFELNYNSKGMVHFKLLSKEKFHVDTSYALTNNQVLEIDSLFKFSKIQSFGSTQFYGTTDGWPMKITFVYNGNKMIHIEGVHIEMPYRIQPILHLFIEELKKRELIHKRKGASK